MKLLPFDLEKALNGAKLVTRDGKEVFGFRDNGEEESGYPYSASVCGVDLTYTKLGYQWHGNQCNTDLFLAAEQPPDLLPNYKRMYEMLYEILEDGILPDRQKTIVKELLLTAKID